MSYRKILSLLLFTAIASLGCASTYKERITSDPPGADIYWGYSQSNFVDTDYVTPFERSLYGKAWEARCYQVQKKGYYDSEVLCRSSETGDRLIHFDLKPKPVEEAKPTVTLESNERKTATIKEKYSETAQASSILLTGAVKETTPTEQGPAVQYIEKYLEENGYKCYVEIFQSRKHRGKFAIVINRYSSEVKFDKDKLTEAAIIAAAILAEHVSWNPSDLFFDYSAIFEIKNKSVGWAIISVEDCVAARNLFMSGNNIDKFTTFWKSKIQYISNTDSEPIL
ncbi:MAG: hypothetical protein AMJ70_09140 [Dehalococcoidia bacterium SG8_51_3]|nr:MAG: hypothetical protein AMJ70_09140 [Dehalococcoidia bacterium SG8_51_3]